MIRSIVAIMLLCASQELPAALSPFASKVRPQCEEVLKDKISDPPKVLTARYHPDPHDLPGENSRERSDAAPYFKAEDQRYIEVGVNQNGQLYYIASGQPVDTDGYDAEFIVTLEGKLLILSSSMLKGEDGKRHLKRLGLEIEPFLDKSGNCCLRTYHSVIAGGEKVLAAGDIRVENGHVEHISNRSGHYLPQAQAIVELWQGLREAGVLSDPTFLIQGLLPNGMLIHTHMSKILTYLNGRSLQNVATSSLVQLVRKISDHSNVSFEIDLLSRGLLDQAGAHILGKRFWEYVPYEAVELTKGVNLELLSENFWLAMDSVLDVSRALGAALSKGKIDNISILHHYYNSGIRREFVNLAFQALSIYSPEELSEHIDLAFLPSDILKSLFKGLTENDWQEKIHSASLIEKQEIYLIFAFRLGYRFPQHKQLFDQISRQSGVYSEINHYFSKRLVNLLMGLELLESNDNNKIE